MEYTLSAMIVKIILKFLSTFEEKLFLRTAEETKSESEYFPRVSCGNANIFPQRHTYYIQDIDFHFFQEKGDRFERQIFHVAVSENI